MRWCTICTPAGFGQLALVFGMLEQIRSFLTVVEEGSLHQAAADLLEQSFGLTPNPMDEAGVELNRKRGK
jgi:hypothetical protein